LRLVFFGTPEFAVPTLARLIEGPHRVVTVVSQPDRERGRGRKRSASPVAELALANEIPLLRPDKVGAPDVVQALREARPDLGVVVAFGQFLPRKIRELPGRGYLINAHASLLPRHRGAAPIAHAILAGDAETGISVMKVEREMDTGAVARVASTPIGPTENTGELTPRLAELAAGVIAGALDDIAADRVAWAPQDDSRATLAPKIERADAQLDFREPAAKLARRVRAMAPKPGAFVSLRAGPLRLLAARNEPGPVDRAPGTVERGGADAIRIATGDGWLVPDVLQRPGGRPLPVDAFLRGFDLADGARLDDDAGADA